MKKVLWVIIVILSIIGVLLGVNAPILTTYAYTYNDHYIDFSQKEVSNFDNYDLVINKDTFNMNVYGDAYFGFYHKESACPTTDFRVTITSYLLLNGVDQGRIQVTSYVIPCSITFNQFVYNPTFIFTDAQKEIIKDVITTESSDYISIETYYYHNELSDPLFNGVTFDFRDMEFGQSIFYEFNSTYYFTHILLDADINYFVPSQFVFYSDGSEDARARLLVAYDSTTYNRWWNDDPISSITRGRKKYAVDDNGEHITAYGIGVGTEANAPYNSGFYIKSNSVASWVKFRTTIYTLNYASTQQTFPNATTDVLWDYIDPCPIWDMSCGINNALVYLAKDAPITSQVYNVVDKGWQFLSNSFYSLTDLFGAEFDDQGNLVGGNWIGIIITITLGLLVIIWGVREL